MAMTIAVTCSSLSGNLSLIDTKIIDAIAAQNLREPINAFTKSGIIASQQRKHHLAREKLSVQASVDLLCVQVMPPKLCEPGPVETPHCWNEIRFLVRDNQNRETANQR
jgi:hypothetical protein